jgi:hypothetical protein
MTRMTIFAKFGLKLDLLVAEAIEDGIGSESLADTLEKKAEEVNRLNLPELCLSVSPARGRRLVIRRGPSGRPNDEPLGKAAPMTTIG